VVFLSENLKDKVREFKMKNKTNSLKENLAFNARRIKVASEIENHDSVKKGLSGVMFGLVVAGVGHLASALTGIDALEDIGNVAGGVVAGVSLYENGKNLAEGAMEIKDIEELEIMEKILRKEKEEEENIKKLEFNYE
jgi:hypothetical protein